MRGARDGWETDGAKPADPSTAGGGHLVGWGAPARAALAVADPVMRGEVLDLLGRQANVEVVGTAADLDGLRSIRADGGIDVVVACPEVLSGGGRRRPDRWDGDQEGTLLLVSPGLTVDVLRVAIRVGASGAYAWPQERDEICLAVASEKRRQGVAGSPTAVVAAVLGARGGVGATFLATHLAAVMADRGLRTVLVDMDAGASDVTPALGITPSQELRTVSDLVPVAPEISADHLRQVLYRHPRGFDALLGPSEPPRDEPIPAGVFPAVVATAATVSDVVLTLLPKGLDSVARTGTEMADHLLLLTTLNLLSLYGARRAIQGLGLEGRQEKCRVVINRAGRSDVSVADVERVLGLPVVASLPTDGRVARAQDRGEMASPSRRVARELGALAETIAPAASQAVARERR